MTTYTFNELNSTNLHLKQNFNNYENFDVILANHQTNGYGRFKRAWLDLGNDNIFMSICLKLDGFNENILGITQYTALVLAKTFELYKINPTIKWSNDILINGKKISGILAESVIKHSKFEGIVLGIGININASKNSFENVNQKVTSLKEETSNVIDKNEFINKFMDIFKKDYDLFLEKGFVEFRVEYKSYLKCLNKEISLKNGENTITGIAKDVTNSGMLLLETDGEIQEISAGDISY